MQLEWFHVAALWAANNIGVWAAVFLCAYLDKQSWTRANKLQPKEPLTPAVWWECFRDTLTNQGIFLPIFLLPLLYFYQPRDDLRPLQLLIDVPLIILLNDTGYYWTHRLFHMKPFYVWFHKKYARACDHLLFISSLLTLQLSQCGRPYVGTIASPHPKVSPPST